MAIFATCFINYNDPGVGRDLMAILDHNEIPFVFAEKEACCGMPKLELGDLESVGEVEGDQHPATGQARARRLRDTDSDTVVHADVQAGTAADVSRRRGRQGGAGRDVRSVRVSGGAAEGRPAQDRLHGAAGQGLVPYSLPPARPERRPEDPRSTAIGAGDRIEHHRGCSGHAGT
ncbi:MAG: (Fe-S)-binding protein [Betaproteobacteria bacterium]|nr:(Fe-S)-binding protein [Betaproteobacteria bacterium]